MGSVWGGITFLQVPLKPHSAPAISGGYAKILTLFPLFCTFMRRCVPWPTLSQWWRGWFFFSLTGWHPVPAFSVMSCARTMLKHPLCTSEGLRSSKKCSRCFWCRSQMATLILLIFLKQTLLKCSPKGGHLFLRKVSSCPWKQSKERPQEMARENKIRQWEKPAKKSFSWRRKSLFHPLPIKLMTWCAYVCAPSLHNKWPLDRWVMLC